MIPIGVESGNTLGEGNDYMETPRYLKAITENNSPRYDWGPKKKINHYGLYAHLNKLQSKTDIALNGIHAKSTTGFINQDFQNDNNLNKDEMDFNEGKF
jgi:hypothetical protein